LNPSILDAVDPGHCPHGTEIVRYATLRGIAQPRLAREFPFGWYLMGEGEPGLLSQVAAEMSIYRGGGGSDWRQIDPSTYVSPMLRAEMLLTEMECLVNGKLSEIQPAQLDGGFRFLLLVDGEIRSPDGYLLRAADERSIHLAEVIHHNYNWKYSGDGDPDDHSSIHAPGN
jgi:hypothetical protein